STRRLGATLLTTRPQNIMPHATDVPEISTVVFRRPDGHLESHQIPWTKSGLPLVNIGRYFSPAVAKHIRRGPPDDRETPEELPEYLKVLDRLQNCRIPSKVLTGFGALTPVFAASLPASFVQRLGRVTSDPFFSGVFEAGGHKIGFIRIPTYAPTNSV